MPPFLLTEEGPSPSCLAVMYKQAISIHFVGQMLTSPKSSFKVQTELDLQREWRGSRASSTPPWVFICSPAVPLGKLWASVTGLLKEVSEWPFQLTPREWSCHAQGFARELKDLRVSGFLFLADLDLYFACYQVCPMAPWAKRDYFPAQVAGSLVLGTSHQLLQASFCRTETAFVLFQRASDIWQILKKHHHLKFFFSLRFFFFPTWGLFSFAFSLQSHWEDVLWEFLCPDSTYCSPTSLIMAPGDSTS